MEQSPSSEANSCSASYEIPSILYNPNLYSVLYKTSRFVLIQNQMNPVHSILHIWDQF